MRPPDVGTSSLTRRQVADNLGISVSSVRRLETVCLHPTQNSSGVWLFDRAEVEAVAATRAPRRSKKPVKPKRTKQPGEVAAQVFRLLDERMSLREIVVRARVAPELVRRLYREWSVSLADGERARQQQELVRQLQRQQLDAERLAVDDLKSFEPYRRG